MIRAALASLVWLAACPHVSAGDVAAAGRIDSTLSGGSCSGVLVAPDIVATAAHCTPVDDPSSLVFTTGDGRHTSRIRRAERHPLYTPGQARTDWKLRFDIGALALSDPPEGIEPMPLGPEAEPGETLFIVSWRKVDGPRPRQRACPVLSVGVEGLVTLGCPVVGGESGAPVLRRTQDGLELVAIVSSRARLLDQPIAQASNVRLRIPPLLDQIRSPASP